MYHTMFILKFVANGDKDWLLILLEILYGILVVPKTENFASDVSEDDVPSNQCLSILYNTQNIRSRKLCTLRL